MPCPAQPQSPQLILADEDLALELGSIVVAGALRAGGPDCRLASRLTLTFRPQPGVDTFNMVGCGGGWVQEWNGVSERLRARAALERS